MENENLINDNKHIISIDEILDKIGYTWYHYIVYIITAFTLIADGSEIFTIYLMSPVIKRIYKLPIWVNIFMVSSIFIGFGIGSLFTGFLNKKFNRKLPALISLIGIIIFGVICVLIDNIWWFIFCRIMIGLGIGVLINFVNSLFEILPSKFRDFLIGSIFIFYKIGIVYFCLIVMGLMDDSKGYLAEKNWKIATALSVSLNILSIILILLFYRESPRIYLWNNKIEEGIEELEILAKMNNLTITSYEKIGLINFIQKEKKEGVDTQWDIVKYIFSPKLVLLTTIVLILWVLNSLVLYGNHYALPMILEKLNRLKNNHKYMQEILISHIIPIPGEIITGLITSTKFFGRKNTILFGFLFTGIFALVGTFDHRNIYIYSSLITFFNIFSFNITKLYTSEAYHSSMRDSVYGYGNSVTRIGGQLTPVIVDISIYYHTFGPVYAILSYGIIGTILAIMLPFDTYGKIIDTDENTQKLSN